MAYPGAILLGLTKGGLAPTRLEDTDHYRLMRDFICDPKVFIETALGE
jgi:predicted ATPase